MEERPTTMRAVVCSGIKQWAYVNDSPVPQPGKEEILTRVLGVGICASDVKMFDGAEFYFGPGGRVKSLPVIPGHEFVAEVVALGEGAAEKHKVDVGDMVVSEQIVPCHNCPYCKDGSYHKCDMPTIYGQGMNGAMSEYMIFPSTSFVHKVPKGLTAEQAVFCEPLGCSVHAVERGQVKEGDVVVVSGCGPLGLGALAALKKFTKAKTIVGLDTLEFRLDLAKRCGADYVFNPAKEDAIAAVRALSGGYGAHVYIDATGHPKSVDQGFEILRKMGNFVALSIFATNVTADWNFISGKKELNIFGSNLGPHCWPQTLELLASGILPLEDIVTHRFPLSKYEEGLEMVRNAVQQNSIKVMLDPRM